MHHEQLYSAHINGSSASGHGNNNSIASPNTVSCTSGEINAFELSLYYHQLMRKQNSIGSSNNAKMIPRMPDPVYALNSSQEMGLKLVQVLDFELPNDNPVEEKYRTLQHELLRGLVDPALKPDAYERSQLNAIIGGTGQHLTREEKGKFQQYFFIINWCILSVPMFILFAFRFALEI